MDRDTWKNATPEARRALEQSHDSMSDLLSRPSRGLTIARALCIILAVLVITFIALR